MSHSVGFNLTHLHDSFLKTKVIADQTKTGSNLKACKRHFKNSFGKFCQTYNGWNRELASSTFSSLALRLMSEWSDRWRVDSEALTFGYPPTLSIAGMQYTKLEQLSKDKNCDDFAEIDAARKAKALFKSALFECFAIFGVDGVKKCLGGKDGISRRLSQKIDHWYSEYNAM